MNKLADFLNKELSTRKWSQADLSREAGLKRQTVNYILSGHSKNPDADTMAKLAKALKIPVEELYRAASVLPSVSLEDKLRNRILERLSRMSPEEQEQALKIIDALSKDDDAPRKKNRRAVEHTFG